MVDVHLPTTDGRTLILSRYTEPEHDQQLLLDRLRLGLPRTTPPRIAATLEAHLAKRLVVPTFGIPVEIRTIAYAKNRRE